MLLLLPGTQRHLARKDQSIFYQPECKGPQCNMFGIDQDCCACYNDCATCETYLWEQDTS